MIRTIVIGLLLTAVVTGILAAVFGSGVLLPVAVFGLLAVAVQGGAALAMRGAMRLSQAEFLKRYGIGMGLRLVGVLVLLVVVATWRERFPPLPTALGFLGVLIPLLFFETRPTR